MSGARLLPHDVVTLVVESWKLKWMNEPSLGEKPCWLVDWLKTAKSLMEKMLGIASQTRFSSRGALRARDASGRRVRKRMARIRMRRVVWLKKRGRDETGGRVR